VEYRVHLAAAGIIVLLMILFVLNGIAIYLRKKFEIKW
jgi:ABC-type phosphate transport system permease subunit